EDRRRQELRRRQRCDAEEKLKEGSAETEGRELPWTPAPAESDLGDVDLRSQQGNSSHCRGGREDQPRHGKNEGNERERSRSNPFVPGSESHENGPRGETCKRRPVRYQQH